MALLTKMEDIAAEISGVRTKISALETKIAVIERKRDEEGLSDQEQAELTTLTTKEAALTNKDVELLKRLPLPGIHSVSMLYFIDNR